MDIASARLSEQGKVSRRHLGLPREGELAGPGETDPSSILDQAGEAAPG